MAAQNRRTVGDQEWLDISARIFGSDEMEEKPYPLPNANVTIQCLNDTLAGRKSTATNREGKFDLELNVLKKRIKKKESARIRLQVSYVGYETIDSVFTMKQIYYDSSHKSDGYFWELEIDSLIMRSKPMSSEEVLIVDELKRMYESGDTTVFNVDAFMTGRLRSGVVGNRTHRELLQGKPNQMVWFWRSAGIRVTDSEFRDATMWNLFLHGLQGVSRHAESGQCEALGGRYDYEESGEQSGDCQARGGHIDQAQHLQAEDGECAVEFRWEGRVVHVGATGRLAADDFVENEQQRRQRYIQ